MIENFYYAVDIDYKNGAILRVYSKTTGFSLDNNKLKIGSFRLQLVSSNNDKNIIFGKEQSLSYKEKILNGLLLSWNGPLSNQNGNKIDIDVFMEIMFRGKGLEFQLTVKNNSLYQILEVQSPFIGCLLNLYEIEDDNLKINAPRSEDLFKCKLKKFLWTNLKNTSKEASPCGFGMGTLRGLLGFGVFLL